MESIEFVGLFALLRRAQHPAPSLLSAVAAFPNATCMHIAYCMICGRFFVEMYFSSTNETTDTRHRNYLCATIVTPPDAVPIRGIELTKLMSNAEDDHIFMHQYPSLTHT
jgi:hypothetical protein